MVDGLDLDTNFKNSVANFVNSYNGTNEGDAAAFFKNLLVLLHRYAVCKIKSDAFDDIKFSTDNLNDSLKEIDEDIDILTKGESFSDMPV